jgi:hypothetical protein
MIPAGHDHKEGSEKSTAAGAGKHYKVVLSDSKRSCQCIDHRIRRHDCKHIRLMLQTLKIADKPQDWFSATQKLVKHQAQQVGAQAEPRHAALATPKKRRKK